MVFLQKNDRIEFKNYLRMKNFILLLSHKHNEILRFLLVLISVFIIAYMLPDEPKFKYKFQKGKTWKYDDLHAPFDFAINKTKAEIDSEKTEVVKNQLSYFKLNTGIKETQISNFTKELEKKWENVQEELGGKNAKNKEKTKKFQLEAGIEILRQIYDKGVVQLTDELEKNPKNSIMVVYNNYEGFKEVAEEGELQDIYTVKTAYDYIHKRINDNPKINLGFLTSLLESAIIPNILYDKTYTQQAQEQSTNDISLTHGMMQKNDLLITKGEMVDLNKFKILESFRVEYFNKLGVGNNTFIRIGQLLLVSISLIVLMVFLALFRKDIIADNKRIALLLSLIMFMAFLYSWSFKSHLFNLYLIPFCIIPIVVRAFFDTRLALFIHIVIILIISTIVPNDFEFVFLQITAGMVAIFSIVNMRTRSQFFTSSAYIFLTYGLAYTGIALIHENSFAAVDWSSMKWLVGNALLTLFAYPLIYLVEKVFGFISDVSLMELSDANTPLLKEFAMKAPGTFQHSLQVANLAEAVIYKIGGNTLMVRAGALYHDIGKMDMPLYFIENQISTVNPHDDISFEESAKIIISHVIRGIETAKKHNLPEQVIDFIRTHHGDTVVQYFYQSYLKNYPNEFVDEEQFRYPGPLPFSKETAVLMMADSVEAASRSLKQANTEMIENLVENIIDYQMNQKQFINCSITFKDISVAKKIFKKMLTSIYHARIEYPR